MKGWKGAGVQGVKDVADKRKHEEMLEAARESSRAGRERVFSALGRGPGRPRGAGAAAADTPPPLPLGGRKMQVPQRFVVNENVRDWRSSDKNGRDKNGRRRTEQCALGAPLSEVRWGLLDAGGRTNALVESGRGTHHGAVADMSGRVKARAGRLAADLLGSATHAVTPDDPEGGLALGQETLLKDKVKTITAATARIQAMRRGTSVSATLYSNAMSTMSVSGEAIFAAPCPLYVFVWSITNEIYRVHGARVTPPPMMASPSRLP